MGDGNLPKRPHALRGLTRRIRVRSVLLSGLRKPSNAWGHWLALEMSKGMIPALCLLGLGRLGLTVPLWLGLASVLGFGAWALFVLSTASVVAFRLLRRRTAWLKSVGHDPDFRSLLTNGSAWRDSLKGIPQREYLRAQLAAHTAKGRPGFPERP